VFNNLLKTASKEEIIEALSKNINVDSEESFFNQKATKFAEIILSVIIPLREQNLLFNPEGRPLDTLNVEEFIKWCDLVSLKTLYFTLKQSNVSNSLLRTKYQKLEADNYKEIDIKLLTNYVKENAINLDEELYDFPIRNYNLHMGIGSVIRNAMK